jgi:hypothetical protein
MLAKWPLVIHVIAQAISLGLAVLGLDALSMGGPTGVVGWIAFLIVESLPLVVWVTKNTKAALPVQAVLFAIAILASVYLVVV